MKTRDGALRNTMFSSVGIYTEYFLGMVAAILVARHLGPAAYGVYGLFMWFVAIGVVISNSGITTGVIKFVAEARGAGHAEQIVPVIRRLQFAQRMHLVVAAILAVGAYAFLRQRLPVAMRLDEFLMLLVAMAMRTTYMFNVSTAKGFEAFDATARVAMVAAPANLVMIVVAMLLQGSIYWFIVVYALSSVVFLAISQYEVRRLTQRLPRDAALPADLRQRMSRHLRLVSATVVIGFFIASGVEVLFLTMYDSTQAAGYFKVAYQLATGVTLLVPGVFAELLLPMMAKALSQGGQVAGRRFVVVTSYLALLAVPVIVFCAVFAGPVIRLLYGTSYAPAAVVFAWVAFACGIGCVTQGATSLLVSADRQHVILVLTIVFGALKVALDVILISRFGLEGAIAAVVLGGLIGSATYFVVGIRVSATQLDWSRLLRIVIAGGGAALVAVPVHGLALPPIAALLIGGICVTASYLLFTLVFGCWTEDDLDQLRQLHRRFAGGRPRVVGLLLAWAGGRAARREQA